ncbi:hypothetical protein ALQ94_100855 [Pseudomonas amygdali pv. morsprunorum]|uniref:Uncharacterized protein n=1 Tax=Pseudomonas amygdali pv. morsprunorum TaxID=129138 RepID=A0A3M2WBL1_PSEA0|nr:hypothetical protein ALQ94_100855 [Pseudomonas amygdali pv. morsprunorum]
MGNTDNPVSNHEQARKRRPHGLRCTVRQNSTGGSTITKPSQTPQAGLAVNAKHSCSMNYIIQYIYN